MAYLFNQATRNKTLKWQSEAISITRTKLTTNADYHILPTTTIAPSGDEFRDPISWTTTRQDPAVFHLTPMHVRRGKLAHEASEIHKLEKPNEDQGLITIKPVANTSGMPDDTTNEIP
jgi:hypothetical protein